MRSLCAVVPREEGESARKKLSELGLLRTDLKIAREESHLYIPMSEAAELSFPLDERDFEESEGFVNYKELAKIPQEMKAQLPTSFDVIGDVYIIKLPDELLPYTEEIGKALLEAHKNARVVALDRGIIGELRTRGLKVIAGEDRTLTVHTEYGIRYQLDPAKVYFSPRLATERKRVSDLAGPDERIIDMFAGVGPFSLMLARFSEPRIVYAVDKNPDAINFLMTNIKMNKIKNLSPMLGDTRELMPGLANPDRVIMNLPHSSLEFLDIALQRVNPGGTVHLYAVAEKEGLETLKTRILDVAEVTGKSLARVEPRTVHTYSPSQDLYCFDLLIG
jgi:tRNA (guanine37-N1)-methyltransferase